MVRRVKRSPAEPMRPFDAVLLDLLMAVMNSLDAWAAAAGDRERGLRWRDAVTARMAAAPRYVPYERLVAHAAAGMGLPAGATDRLVESWSEMHPWPDAAALADLSVPYAFVTNCSRGLADVAAARSALRPRFTLSAEEAGRYKPAPEAYREACRRIGFAPERTLFVAGSPYDAQGARGAGLRAWLVPRRPDLPAPAGGIRVVRSLRELPVALAE